MNPSKSANSKGQQQPTKNSKPKEQPLTSVANSKSIQPSQATTLPSILKLKPTEPEMNPKDQSVLKTSRTAQKGTLASLDEDSSPQSGQKGTKKSVSIDSKAKDQNNKTTGKQLETLDASKSATANLQAKAKQQVIDMKSFETPAKKTKPLPLEQDKNVVLIASQKIVKSDQKPDPKGRSLSTSRSENLKNSNIKSVINATDSQLKGIKPSRLEPLPQITRVKKDLTKIMLKRSVSIAVINNTPRIEAMRPKIKISSSISSSKLNTTRINEHDFELERNHLVHSNKYADIIMKVPVKLLEEPKKLAGYMARYAETELEKAWIVFMWITHNIKYDCETPAQKQATVNQDPLVVLSRRLAVSTGYCHLYKVLAELLGISCCIVQGYARTFAPSVATKENSMSDHEWIAAKLYSRWYLIDPTWAAGYVDGEKNGFVFDFEPFWFLTSPNEFIYRHLPKDPKWQFLENQVVDEKGFLNLLFVNAVFFKYRLGVSSDPENDGPFPRLQRVRSNDGSDTLTVQSGVFQEKIICPPEIDLRVYIIPAEGGKKYEAFVQRVKNHYTITASMQFKGMATIQIFARKFYEENFFKEAMKFNVNSLQIALTSCYQTPVKFNDYDLNRCHLYEPMFVSFNKGDKVFFRIKILNPSVTAVAMHVKNDEDWRKLDKSETEKGVWESEVIVEGMPLQVAVKTTTMKRFKPILEYSLDTPETQ